MNAKQKRSFPARLARLRQRFERMRQTRNPRSRIPDTLWTAAVKAAEAYGLNRTAKTLRLDYYSLKRKVEQKVAVVSETKAGGEPRFVELTTPLSVSPCECIIELKNADVTKMHIRLKSIETPDLAALTRSFWDQQR
jgi:hypothetical protein